MCCKHLDLAVKELNFEENIIVDINEIGWVWTRFVWPTYTDMWQDLVTIVMNL